MLEENWRKKWSDEPAKDPYNSYGHFRFVWNVQRLATGAEISLYVKHPERVFTRSKKFLDKDSIWWGGPKSGEKYIYLKHPLVEEQTIWQAIYLLELHKQGITAEVPLAIVEGFDGSNKLGDSELILHDVERFSYDKKFSLENLDSRLEKIGLVTEDLGGHNIICSPYKKDAKPAIIDVNRWLWPPYTDSWRNKLTEHIKKAVAECK